MKNYLRILFIFVILNGCEDKTVITNAYYTDINPDIILHQNESTKIDMDKDGVQDLIFNYTHSFAEISALDDSYQICKGSAIGSGGYPFDTIGFNEIIDYALEWHSSCGLYPSEIEYLGIRKNTNFQALFGWIKIELGESTVTIKEHYLSDDHNDIIRAGIFNYN